MLNAEISDNIMNRIEPTFEQTAIASFNSTEPKFKVDTQWALKSAMLYAKKRKSPVSDYSANISKMKQTCLLLWCLMVLFFVLKSSALNGVTVALLNTLLVGCALLCVAGLWVLDHRRLNYQTNGIYWFFSLTFLPLSVPWYLLCNYRFINSLLLIFTFSGMLLTAHALAQHAPTIMNTLITQSHYALSHYW